MRIGKRLFPYPILNNERIYSQFKDAIFTLSYSEMITDDYYILQNLYCNLTSQYLIDLIKEGKAKIVCLVECGTTLYRRSFDLKLEPIDLKIPLNDLNGKTTVSAFVVAVQDIDDYECSDFLDDYSGYKFNIEKNDILAVDDGFTNRIDFNSDEDDNKKTSIFLVIKDKTIVDETMNIEADTERIYIYLPEEQYNSYEKTKRISKFQNLYFSIMAIPALGYAISQLQKNSTDVEQLRMENKWFNSFCVAYKNVHNEDLTDEEFIKMNGNKEAQILFNMPVTKALDDIFSLTMGSFGGMEDGD